MHTVPCPYRMEGDAHLVPQCGQDAHSRFIFSRGHATPPDREFLSRSRSIVGAKGPHSPFYTLPSTVILGCPRAICLIPNECPAKGFWYSGRLDLLSFSTSWENGQREGLECNQTAAGYSIRIRGSYAFG